jgi:hypothetical protein
LENLEFLCEILLKRVPITLTAIDWLCVHYSIHANVKYVIQDGDKEKKIELGKDHKKNLDLFSRKYFGVFCRHERILISFTSRLLEKYLLPGTNDGSIHWIKKMIIGTRSIENRIHYYLVTSFGQLLFFYWAFNVGVIHYCSLHLREILSHHRKKKGQPKKAGKRRRFCESPIRAPQVKNDLLNILQDENGLTSNI